MRRPTLVGIALFAIVPFATAPGDYVVAQYRECVTKLAMSSQPDRYREYFEDLRGLAWKLGWSMPSALALALQLLGAVGAIGLCLQIRRRWREPLAALLLYAVAAVYLMLFNPRTQPNSFVILAPAAALPAALLVAQRRGRAALALVALVVCWSGAARFAESWLKPVSCLVFAALLVREIRAPRLFAPMRSS
jgi:hypothetical protein